MSKGINSLVEKDIKDFKGIKEWRKIFRPYIKMFKVLHDYLLLNFLQR
jgi:hypothetical protein